MSLTRKKTLELKDPIYQLYSVEGRSLNYISKLFNLSRQAMTDTIKNELGFTQANKRIATPRIQKLIKKHRDFIVMYLRDSASKDLKSLFEATGITRGEFRTICANCEEINGLAKEFSSRDSESERYRKRMAAKRAEWANEAEALDGEIWVDIKGYEGLYWVSNKSRIKNKEKIIKPSFNEKHGRYQIRLYKNGKGNTYKVYRIVANAFIENPYSFSTVNHKNGDCSDDRMENLEWASQKYQNWHKIEVLGRKKAISHKRNGRFKEVLIDGKYRFKTLKAAAKFIGVSESHFQRYLSGETAFDRKIELIF